MIVTKIDHCSEEFDQIVRLDDGSVRVRAYVDDDPSLKSDPTVTQIGEYLWEKTFTHKAGEIYIPTEVDRFRAELPGDALCIYPAGFSKVKDGMWGMRSGSRYLACARRILSLAVQKFLHRKPKARLLFLHGASFTGLDAMSLEIVSRYSEHMFAAGFTCAAFALYIKDEAGFGGPVYISRTRGAWKDVVGEEWIHLMLVLSGRDFVAEQLFCRFMAGQPWVNCPILDIIAPEPPPLTAMVEKVKGSGEMVREVQDTAAILRRCHADLTRPIPGELDLKADRGEEMETLIAERLAIVMARRSREMQLYPDEIQYPW